MAFTAWSTSNMDRLSVCVKLEGASQVHKQRQGKAELGEAKALEGKARQGRAGQYRAAGQGKTRQGDGRAR